MTVSVLVPWRPDGGQRDRIWAHLRPRWEQLGYEVIEGHCVDVEWRKAVAVDDAYLQSTGDVLVVADADVWCDDIDQAVADVAAGRICSVPHTMVRRLTDQATADVLNGAPLTNALPLEERPYIGRVGGGILVLQRHVWELAPIDVRFAGWGQEDEAWCIALAKTWGMPQRHEAHLWHLWHPPQPRRNRAIGSAASFDLFAAYADKRRFDATLREAREELLRERKRRTQLHRRPPAARC